MLLRWSQEAGKSMAPILGVGTMLQYTLEQASAIFADSVADSWQQGITNQYRARKKS